MSFNEDMIQRNDLSEDVFHLLHELVYHYEERNDWDRVSGYVQRAQDILRRRSSAVKMNRAWAMPSVDTFKVKPIADFVRRYLSESVVSVDPFARNCDWATYTNDLNPETAAQHHMEAAEYLQYQIGRNTRVDLAIFDPPYSLEQCSRSYQDVGRKVREADTQMFGGWYPHKHLLSRMLTDDGIVLSFGWNSCGMGKKHGFKPIEILLVCHGRAHNDTICLAEKRVQPLLRFDKSHAVNAEGG